MTTRAMHAVLSTLVVALLAPGARADLDRPPSILEHRQVGNEVRLLWAPGGNEDGTLNFPKACIGYQATIVIDDDPAPADPFADGPYTEVFKADGTGTIVYCRANQSDPDCQQ